METEILNLSNELEYILIYDQGFLQPDSSKKIRKIAAKAKVASFPDINSEILKRNIYNPFWIMSSIKN